VEKNMLKEVESFKSDSITPLEDPLANDEAVPIMDLIAEEQLESVPKYN
jgi:hypothetical protein